MSAMDMFWAAPPISRTLAASAFFLSVCCHTGMLSFGYVLFTFAQLMKFPPYIWTPITSFLITGAQIGIVIDTYFLYTYSSQLEMGNPRLSGTGDYFMYLVFVCSVILGLNAFVTGGVVFISALILAMCYTSTQDARGQKATFIVVQIPAQFIPYAMLLMTLVMNGAGAAKIQATGLVAAHLYDFLTRLYPTFRGGRNMLSTPAFVKRMWETTVPGVGNRAYGTAFTPAQRPGAASGSTSGAVLPESWRSRGSGHRLGGD
ncbi:related to F-LANa protein [Rhynchosporium agropyri]|uniref:Derlin n=2 Tax=Rhynchosporium TaxID=38037 RepID=A0A1E1LUC3_RHYSE|nr:related to F-LANa protein [Rhynchosporium agropyri]CZT40088.1 related to F-LANa protein [Rhynchosporium secalis]